MAQTHQTPSKATVAPAPSVVRPSPAPQPRGNSAAQAQTRHNDLNTATPGSEASRRPLPDLRALEAKGYRVTPAAGMEALYSAAKDLPDKPLAQQPVGNGGYDVVSSGTFTVDYVHSAGPVMRDGKLDTQGHEKSASRGGVAMLEDGSIVVGRGKGRDAASVQSQFAKKDSKVKDFMGGGALLIENGRKVDSADLREQQRFDQGKGGLDAQQMRSTHHVLVGIRDGQAFHILAKARTGRQIQDDLAASGFDSVVKFDGGSGGYFREGPGAASHAGQNTTGLGVRARR